MLEDMYCRKHSGCPNVSDSLSRCQTGEQQVLRGALTPDEQQVLHVALAPDEQHVLWGALARTDGQQVLRGALTRTDGQQVLRGVLALNELILIKDEYM